MKSKKGSTSGGSKKSAPVGKKPDLPDVPKPPDPYPGTTKMPTLKQPPQPLPWPPPKKERPR